MFPIGNMDEITDTEPNLMRIDAVPHKKQRTHFLYCYGKISEVCT